MLSIAGVMRKMDTGFLLAALLAVTAPVSLSQAPPEPEGYSVRGWSAIAPERSHVAVRGLAYASDGVYVAADVAGSLPQSGLPEGTMTDVFLARFDSSGELAWSTSIAGEDRDVVRAVAVDQAGYVLLAGSTRSPDFPWLNSVEEGVPVESQAAFLWKIDPATGSVVYSTIFGAYVPRADFGPVQSEALDVAVDSAGNAYVTGWTTSRYFPVTGDAFDPDWMGGTALVQSKVGFVAIFRPDGELSYATYLGGQSRHCGGGSSCLSSPAYTYGLKVAVGPGGAVFVGGVTNTTDFPITGDAYQAECACSRYAGDIFLARFAPGGRELEYATYLGGGPNNDRGVERLTDLAVDSAGAAYLAGWTAAPDFPTTAGAFQPQFHQPAGQPGFQPLGVDGFVTKLSPDGRALELSTFVGGFEEDCVDALALREDGSVVLTGYSESAELAAQEGRLETGNAILTTLRPDGSGIDFLTRLPTGGALSGRCQWGFAPNPIAGVLALSNDEAAVAIDGGIVDYFDKAVPGESRLWALTSAADFEIARVIAPGELLTLFGVNIGPKEPTWPGLDQNGAVPFDLAGIRVTFDGAPAPILYAQNDQINVVAPFGLRRDGLSTIQIVREAEPLEPRETATRAVAPAIFRAGQAWAILNPDSSLNSFDFPAAPDSVVAAWATGAGAMAPAPADGAVAAPPFAAIEAGVRVFVGYDEIESEVVYAGAAPGLVQGVVQINFRLPAGLPRSSDGTPRGEPVVLEIGGVRAPLTFVFVG